MIFESRFFCGMCGMYEFIGGSNVEITDAIRMHMEVNRRLHEQLGQ